ncbi:MAG TPA: phosphotransferase [Ktedonobacteraceae bacterium]|nr:phosphotransferase [Ktedonobacteraceae bacterium]
MNLEQHIGNHFGLSSVVCTPLNTPTNDVLVVTTSTGRFALKLYHLRRTAAEVQWELDLIIALMRNGAPVAKPVRGKHGYVESFRVDGRDRAAALFEWVPGSKPAPERDTYTLLGKAAAQIHQAADTFTSSFPREGYDAHTLIDEQLHRMKMYLSEAKRWKQAVALGERLKQAIANPALDRGICHMDLTLDNAHRHGESITVFDFDSAGACWRSIEPHGILRSSQEFFEAWLDGYRSVRPFSRHDEKAVAAFSIIGDLRVVAWDLGVARSSRGKPLLEISDLPGVVDTWLDWERKNIYF